LLLLINTEERSTPVVVSLEQKADDPLDGDRGGANAAEDDGEYEKEAGEQV